MNIALKDIHKHYGNIRANDGISMDIPPGTIQGILGENGAGKSTLMKVLAGYVPKTSGIIELDGQAVEYEGPAHANRLGIGMLYQDPLDFPSLSVLENYMIGRSTGIACRKDEDRKQFLADADRFGFQIHPDIPVRALTVGERQQLEILRLLAIGVDVLILDEPTTGISSLQKNILFDALKKLARQEKSVLLVSHKLEDVEALCDRITVLRQGRVTGQMALPFDTRQVLEWMFGSLPEPPACAESETGLTVIAMKGVSAQGGRTGLRDCHVTIHQGEVVGLAGLEGSGQGVFLRVAAGLQRPVKGVIEIGGKNMTGQDHHTFKAHGVTFLPTARLEEGLISGLTITEHFALREGRGVMIPWVRSMEEAGEKINQFRIIGSPYDPVESLSGGNQQRLLLALMPDNPLILLLENPTRGLDMESVNWVWQQLTVHVEKGCSIVFSSPELDEIMQVSDRVLVFFNGAVVKDVRTCDTNLQELGQWIAGRV